MRKLLKPLREARSEIIGGLLVAAVTSVVGALDARFGIRAIVVGIVGIAQGAPQSDRLKIIVGLMLFVGGILGIFVTAFLYFSWFIFPG